MRGDSEGGRTSWVYNCYTLLTLQIKSSQKIKDFSLGLKMRIAGKEVILELLVFLQQKCTISVINKETNPELKN